MSLSEFRYNKKRKHYAYLYKAIGNVVLNVTLTTKPYRIVHNKQRPNIKLYKHPNSNSTKDVYVIPYVYVDSLTSFTSKIYKWSFISNDKRKIKRIRKAFYKRKSQL